MSILVMVIWGFIGWFGLGIEKAGVLGDSMSPIASLITAFALGAALYSLDVQRKVLSSQQSALENERRHDNENKKFESFLNKLEHLDTQHHVSTHCPWCEILEKVKQK